MIIKTYNPETLQEKETISEITSIIFNRRFYKVGSFEIQTTSDKFETEDIIAYSYNGEIRSGIVMKISENNDTFNVSGYDLKGVYGFRYIAKPAEISGTPDEIIKSLVNEYLKTDDRNIEGLIVSSEAVVGDSIKYTPSEGYLEKTMESLGISHEIGTSIEFDLENLNFKTLKGEDRSQDVKFGRRYYNVEKIEHTKDLFNTYNVGYYLNEEVLCSSGTAKGILRREGCSRDKIDEFLKEKAPAETIVAEANEKYVYGVDYKLGDYVTVLTRTAETVKQITEIKEVHENSRHTVIPIFGVEKENPIKKLMKGM